MLVAHGAAALDGVRADAWVYFGRSIEAYLAARDRLQDVTAIAGGPLVCEVVDAHRDELLGFDEALELRDPLSWHAGDLAERLQTHSTFVYSCAAAIATARLLESLESDLLVVVDDVALQSRVVGLAQERGHEASALSGNSASVAGAWVRALRERASFLRQLARHRRLIDTRLSLPAQLDVLVTTWADSRTFTPGRPLERDTYFGVLPHLLRERGVRVGYLANPLTWVEPPEPILSNALASAEHVILPEQCVRLRDAVRIVVRSLRSSARRTRPHVVGGIDLSSLLDVELAQERLRFRRCFALQFEYVPRALRRANVEVDRLLHPFENQSWEKVLRLAFREQLPGTRIVGFQASHIPNHWFSFFPSRRDVAAKVLPDDIIVFGRVWQRLLAERGVPQELLKLGAALRFEHLRNVQPPPHRGRVVLVAAPIGLDDALELAWKAVEALAEEQDVQLLLCLHPKMSDLSRDQFVDSLLRAARLDALPPHVTISDTPTAELLPHARVLLYSSTVLAYEALAFGVAPVFVQSDFWLDLNSLPPGSTIAPSARTPEEIRKAVLELLEDRGDGRRAETARLLDDAFAEVTPETLSPFL